MNTALCDLQLDQTTLLPGGQLDTAICLYPSVGQVPKTDFSDILAMTTDLKNWFIVQADWWSSQAYCIMINTGL